MRWALGAPLLLTLLGAGVAGCVTRGTHAAVVEERDRLRTENRELSQRVRLVEASIQSLSQERVKLLDQLEDLRVTEASLEESVASLEQRRAALERDLARREAELARRGEEIQRLRGTYQGLVADLEAEVQAGQIQIERLREGLRLNVSDEILFDSGSARLKPDGRDLLARVASRLQEIPDRVEVQGHTDSVPIARGFPSNWELAAARATGVVRWLEERGIDPRRLSGVSYGEHHPVAPNDTPEGRARNRRIEIRLLPESEGAEEAPADPPPATGE